MIGNKTRRRIKRIWSVRQVPRRWPLWLCAVLCLAVLAVALFSIAHALEKLAVVWGLGELPEILGISDRVVYGGFIALWLVAAYAVTRITYVGLRNRWTIECTRVLPDPLCRNCGYNLRGNQSEVCPECGARCHADDSEPLPVGVRRATISRRARLGRLAAWTAALFVAAGIASWAFIVAGAATLNPPGLTITAWDGLVAIEWRGEDRISRGSNSRWNWYAQFSPPFGYNTVQEYSIRASRSFDVAPWKWICSPQFWNIDRLGLGRPRGSPGRASPSGIAIPGMWLAIVPTVIYLGLRWRYRTQIEF